MSMNAALLHEGDQASRTVGPVTITIQRINHASVRVITRYAGPNGIGREIEQLTKSYPHETAARDGANGLWARFRTGATVEQVIADVEHIARELATQQLAAINAVKPFMSNAQYDTLSRVAAAGTSEVVRFEDCSISTVLAMAKPSVRWVDKLTYTWVTRINRRTGREQLVKVLTGAEVTATGWRYFEAERARRAQVRALDATLARVPGQEVTQ